HGGEARAGVDGIGTAHGRVVELAHELVAGASSECLDGLPLPAVAVLVGSDVSPGAGPQLANRSHFLPLRHIFAPTLCIVILRKPYKSLLQRSIEKSNAYPKYLI